MSELNDFSSRFVPESVQKDLRSCVQSSEQPDSDSLARCERNFAESDRDAGPLPHRAVLSKCRVHREVSLKAEAVSVQCGAVLLNKCNKSDRDGRVTRPGRTPGRLRRRTVTDSDSLQWLPVARRRLRVRLPRRPWARRGGSDLSQAHCQSLTRTRPTVGVTASASGHSESLPGRAPGPGDRGSGPGLRLS
eukprot:837542-Rhodomonas_salina.2